MKKRTKVNRNKLLIMGYYNLDEMEALRIANAHDDLNMNIDLLKFTEKVIELSQAGQEAKRISWETLEIEKEALKELNRKTPIDFKMIDRFKK